MDNYSYYILCGLNFFKNVLLNNMFGKTTCAINAYVSDRTRIYKVCFIHLALFRVDINQRLSHCPSCGSIQDFTKWICCL